MLALSQVREHIADFSEREWAPCMFWSRQSFKSKPRGALRDSSRCSVSLSGQTKNRVGLNGLFLLLRERGVDPIPPVVATIVRPIDSIVTFVLPVVGMAIGPVANAILSIFTEVPLVPDAIRADPRPAGSG